MVRWAAIGALCLWAGAAEAQLQGTSGGLPADAKPRWRQSCDLKAADQFGDKKRIYCSLNVSNSAMQLGDNWGMNSNDLVVVDQRGARLVDEFVDTRCSNRSAKLRMSVDGRRIDSLSPTERLKVALNGQVLVREKMALWPYCGVAAHATNLDGFRDAYDVMMSAWASR